MMRWLAAWFRRWRVRRYRRADLQAMKDTGYRTEDGARMGGQDFPQAWRGK